MERKYQITTGKSRTDTDWQPRSVSWIQLCGRLAGAKRTFETVADYKAASKARRAVIKDVGGFVGGTLSGGARKATAMVSRSLVTLDIDYGRADTLGIVSDMLAGTAWCIYSTHSHTPESPRYRLVVPLSRDVTPDEYIPIARRIADTIGIDIFDDSTYQPERLMYWPSVSVDGEYVYEAGEGEPVDADVMLGSYVDWTNVLEWPVSKRVQALSKPNRHKQEDPTEKPGIIGAFCRCYGIAEAIETFLPDVYTPAGDNRYTYAAGSTGGGAVVYEDKWLYSHHGTDPCGTREVNAFDLVRIHRFGALDENTDPDTPVNRLPSYSAMSEFAQKDSKVSAALAQQRLREISEDFADISIEDPENDWLKGLQWDEKHKNMLASPYNFALICRNDPQLKDTARFDIFADKAVLTRDLPWAKLSPEHHHWGNSDDNGLISYISETYGLSNKTALLDAHDLVMWQNSFHPVRDYLSSLSWDGTPRLDTLLVDYLGALDNPLTRAMTRKHFTAAVARIFEPGTKYDYVLTLTGREGIGKSTLIKTLGGPWFDDSFSSADVGDKNAMEQVRGRWLIELGEMKEYKKNTVEAFKAFISKQVDQYRPAYGHKVEIYPRQCVFFATTNETAFLKGDTGNRRFWAVGVYEDMPMMDVFSISKREVDQIWAEACHRYREHEPLYLSAELEAQARERQAEHNEITADDRLGLIEAYIRKPLPDNWASLTRAQRADYFRTNQGPSEGEGQRRKYICAAEVANECFRREMNRYEAKEINQLLARLGLIYRGSMRVSDEEYGGQRRYEIPDEFYTTTG